MNKKDIATLRREFKVDNDLLTIGNIYNVYVRKESSEIYYEENRSFSMLELEDQELFMANFKKILTGKLDVKLFEVKFRREDQESEEEHTQFLLNDSLIKDDIEYWNENMLEIVEKMFKDNPYEKDMVVTFIRGEYFKPTKKTNEESEMNVRDEVYTHPFILCSMNETELPKRSLVFDFIEKEFKSNMMVDPVINLTKPIGGFLFPCFTEQGADVNHLLYAAGKANQPDYGFIEDVLNGEEIVTALEDKAVFEQIVKNVVDGELDTQVLSNVYEEIHQIVEYEKEEGEEEIPTLDSRAVEHVLKSSGVKNVETEKVQEAFKTVIEDEKYELKATNIIPNYTSKSIKIETKVANISISPQDLKYVRRVNFNGKRCLMIEVEEDTMIEGFKMIEEEKLED